jgi:hypothetical protein
MEVKQDMNRKLGKGKRAGEKWQKRNNETQD